MQKPGWKTSEFWLVVASAVLTVAVAGGYITIEQSQQINSALAETINAVAELVTALMPVAGLVMYIWSRAKVKAGK